MNGRPPVKAISDHRGFAIGARLRVQIRYAPEVMLWDKLAGYQGEAGAGEETLGVEALQKLTPRTVPMPKTLFSCEKELRLKKKKKGNPGRANKAGSPV